MRMATSLRLASVAVLLMLAASARSSGAQAVAGEDAKRFVGTWRLISDTQVGIMIYDSFGNMAAQVMPTRARPAFAGAQPTPDEAKAALTGYLAYFGTYTVDEGAHTVAHHRKGSLNPGQIGEDAVRKYQFDGDRLLLFPVPAGNQITWDRAK